MGPFEQVEKNSVNSAPSIVALIAVATVVASAAACASVNPTETSGPAQAQERGDPTSGKSCVLNTALTLAEARERADAWKRIQASRSDTSKAGDGSEACTTVRTFAKDCPRWDLNAPNVVAELCQERGHLACQEGKPLDSRARRDRADRWADLVRIRSRQEGVDFGGWCTRASEFASNCPAWDPQVASLASDLCQRASNDCAHGMTAAERKASAPVIRPKVEARLHTDLDLAGRKDPNDARPEIAEARRLTHQYKCYDPAGAADLEARVETWAAASEKAIDDEIQCRLSDECRARRIANEICATIEDKRQANAGIATERRNPGGVVDLSTLHDLGERVQFDDARITNLKRDYSSLSKKAFTDSLCRP